MRSPQRFPLELLAAFSVGIGAIASAQAQEIWLAPQQSVAPSRQNRAADLMDMFQPNAPWQIAASHIRVFKLYAGFINQSSQEDINTVVADLNRRHIAIALEVGVINVGVKPVRPPCGGLGLVEGYGTTMQAKGVSERIKSAGGVIQYIAMDEPLWFGHYFLEYPKDKPGGGQPGCQTSINDLINLIQPTLQVYQEEFPGIAVGDVEPTAIAEKRNWKDDLSEWTGGFEKLFGKPLAFLQVDINFARPDAEPVAADFYRYAQLLKQRQNLGAIGVIYNGDARDMDDAQWVQDAQQHIRIIEGRYGFRPDLAVFQSWHTKPTHAMPESSPATLTGLVDSYVATHNATNK